MTEMGEDIKYWMFVGGSNRNLTYTKRVIGYFISLHQNLLLKSVLKMKQASHGDTV